MSESAAKGRERASTRLHTRQIQPKTDWERLIPEEQWRIYIIAIEAVRATGLSFMIGGAFGLACYTGRWRNTKDLDFYILPKHRETVIDALTGAGFGDYYDRLPYDRQWIYRSERDGVIVDIIWAMANQRAEVEPDWFEYAPVVRLHGQELQVLPAEELLWCKLYVLQRDRCDWPDVMNILYAVGEQLEWDRLMRRLGDDRCLLRGAVAAFSWLSPQKALLLPEELRSEGCPDPLGNGEMEQRRVRLLDSRPWFAAYQPGDKPLDL